MDQVQERKKSRVREVYFVRAITLGLIKIGVANHALIRVVSLQTHSPDKLEIMGVVMCDNYGFLERLLHGRFEHLRSHGEWFRPGDDLLTYIEENALDWRDAAEERRAMEDGLPIIDDIRRRRALRHAKAAGNEETAAMFRRPR